MEKKATFTLLYILLIPALFLLLSMNQGWPEGWIFSLWLLFLCYCVILYLYRKDPAFLAERFWHLGDDRRERLDRYVFYSLLIGFIVWIVIMPLDVKWFSWSLSFPLFLKALGGAGLVASFFLFLRSYTDNTFRSPHMQDKKDGDRRIGIKGVYGFVRHPMYLGAVLMFFSAPLFLSSVGGIITGCALMILVMARILGEEAILVRDVEGYREYMQNVRYRLIPYLW